MTEFAWSQLSKPERSFRCVFREWQAPAVSGRELKQASEYDLPCLGHHVLTMLMAGGAVGALSA